ncbi:hypothetical protein [Variovorax sp. ZT4R33]|uniref:hypothetical protein n=1 Tax=Variovorax sp. ZT4R33 TaxID=3443743 RepID=UPI003F465C09
MRARSASLKVAVMHQQGPWAMPVRRSVSAAQAFGAWQSGQRVGSAIGSAGMPALSPAPFAAQSLNPWS